MRRRVLAAVQTLAVSFFAVSCYQSHRIGMDAGPDAFVPPTLNLCFAETRRYFYPEDFDIVDGCGNVEVNVVGTWANCDGPPPNGGEAVVVVIRGAGVEVAVYPLDSACPDRICPLVAGLNPEFCEVCAGYTFDDSTFGRGVRIREDGNAHALLGVRHRYRIEVCEL